MDTERTRMHILKELFGNNDYENDPGEYTESEITEIVTVHPLLLKVLADIKAGKEKEVEEPINSKKSNRNSASTSSQKRSLEELTKTLKRGTIEREDR